MLSKQSMTNPLMIRIKMVYHYIGIARVTSCEADDFEMFAEIAKNVFRVGSDIDPSIYNFPCWKFNGQFYIKRRV